jgi:hypothetical protein
MRVLKLFTGIQAIPQLHKQIIALIKSIMGLANVMLFLMFVFMLFGIMGL